jgi:hypothetical protein
VLSPGPTDPIPFPEVEVTYSLFYTINQFRLPNANEFEAVAELTRDHVTPFFVADAAGNPQYTLVASTTVIDDTRFELNEPVEIKYTSTLVYTINSFVPSEARINGIVATAFTGTNGNTYLNAVKGLPSSNIFSTVTAITVDTSVSPSTRTASGSSTTSRILLGAGIGAGLAALVIGAMVLSGRRQKEDENNQKAVGSVGHVTAGDISLDSRSATEHIDEHTGLEEVSMNS